MNMKSNIRLMYLRQRLSNFMFRFNDEHVRSIKSFYSKHKDYYNPKSIILNSGIIPSHALESKPTSDYYSIMLWNEIMPQRFRVSNMAQLKDMAAQYIVYSERMYPNMKNCGEIDFIRFVTAHSSSSFLGLQNPSKSKFSFDSMVKTLSSHTSNNVKYKPWLIPNLGFLKDHIDHDPSIMNRNYGDVCLSARMSSSSIPGEGSYRDFVLQHDLKSLKENFIDTNSVEHLIYAGTRIDRRGKFRLICSFHAVFRIIDYLLNNGSYSLCEGIGLLSRYTTEGYNNRKMWVEYVKMSDRSNFNMICIDYKGFDTQISLNEYTQITKLLNDHRSNDILYGDLLKWFVSWMDQPKPLVVRSGDKIEVIIEYYNTMASGLHGTHSFENLIGISMYLEAQKMGIRLGGFWTNGDDQNILVHKDDVQLFLDFVNKYFNISVEKSLVGSDATVWGKMWFTSLFSPMWEIGTIRSLWEKEGGSVELVEESKFKNNYCKILQVIITLIRCGKSDDVIDKWINMLCSACNPPIDPSRLPIKLENVDTIKVSSLKRERVPKGLESVKYYLKDRHFGLNIFGIQNYYDMLLSMYRNRIIFSLELTKLEYVPKGTEFIIQSGFDYSDKLSDSVPYIFSKLVKDDRLTNERSFVRSVLQSSKSYDGPVFKDYKFWDMKSLAYSIHHRNVDIWTQMVKYA